MPNSWSYWHLNSRAVVWVFMILCSSKLFPNGKYVCSVVDVEATDHTPYNMGQHDRQCIQMTGGPGSCFVLQRRVTAQTRSACRTKWHVECA